MDKKGLIFNIQRFSLHDGPGIRTIVFLKGCGLSCKWCSNPESQNHFSELYYSTTNCLKCNSCYAVCRNGAIDAKNFAESRVDRTKCTRCFDCVVQCPTEALQQKGYYRSPEEILVEIEKDAAVFASSGGGVTFSGGEPFLQKDFLLTCLEQCRKNGIDTAIESCAHVGWETIEATLPCVNHYYIDIKHMDAQMHMEATGVTNALILDNIRKLAGRSKNLTLRMPLIPGFNDSEENLVCLSKFLKEIGLPEIHLLPYHAFGDIKYRNLGRKYEMDPKLPEVVDEAVSKAEEILKSTGIEVYIFS